MPFPSKINDYFHSCSSNATIFIIKSYFYCLVNIVSININPELSLIPQNLHKFTENNQKDLSVIVPELFTRVAFVDMVHNVFIKCVSI